MLNDKTKQVTEMEEGKEVKINDDELQKLGSIVQTNNYITTELGTIKRLEYQIKERTEEVEKLLSEFKTEQSRFYRDLEEKYGPGSLNINTGIFTPTPTQQ